MNGDQGGCVSVVSAPIGARSAVLPHRLRSIHPSILHLSIPYLYFSLSVDVRHRMWISGAGSSKLYYSVSMAVQSRWFISYAQSALHERRSSLTQQPFFSHYWRRGDADCGPGGLGSLASDVCVADLAALIHAKTLLLLRSFISSLCTLFLPFSLCPEAKRSTDTVTQVNASSQAPITRRLGCRIWKRAR
jgi:hypothetical protein